jgi:flagellar FliL protein
VAEETEETEESAEEKGSPLKMVVIVVLVLVLVGGGFLGWMFFSSSDDGSLDPLEAGGSPPVPEEETTSQTYALETFVVNLNDPGGKRYLKTNIQLEYVSEGLTAELDRRLPQLRDMILLQLSSKSLDDIQSVDGKIALRRELIQRINQTLTVGKIRSLYFTEFVIQ